MRVFVYYNLHKHIWSVKALEGENKGRVIRHTDYLILRDCQCKVSSAGRARVLRERCKNVHAGIVGTIANEVPLLRFIEPITYNPYKYDSFVKTNTLESIHQVDWVRFTDKRVYIAQQCKDGKKY